MRPPSPQGRPQPTGAPPAPPRRRGAALGRWLQDPALRTWLDPLPGALQRRRALLAAVLAGLVLVLRPLPPLRALPGWCVGGLLLWALAEALLWLWRPHRWR